MSHDSSEFVSRGYSCAYRCAGRCTYGRALVDLLEMQHASSELLILFEQQLRQGVDRRATRSHGKELRDLLVGSTKLGTRDGLLVAEAIHVRVHRGSDRRWELDPAVEMERRAMQRRACRESRREIRELRHTRNTPRKCEGEVVGGSRRGGSVASASRSRSASGLGRR